MPIPEVQSTS